MIVENKANKQKAVVQTSDNMHCNHAKLLLSLKATTYAMWGTADLAPRPIAGCCHLVNLMVWSHSQYSSIYKFHEDL